MDRLRTPFLVAAAIVSLLTVLVELATLAWFGGDGGKLPTPGLGIPYLALVDGIVLFTVVLLALAVFASAEILGMVQGIATVIASFLLLIASIVLIFKALLLLTLMVTLLLAVPFGTIAYLAAYGDFDVGAARITLGVLFTLKIATVVLIFLAQQRFITVKALVLLLLSSLLANIVVSFLHGFPVPDFLISILDAVAALVVAIIAVVWSLVKLIGSIPGAIKGLRVDRHFS